MKKYLKTAQLFLLILLIILTLLDFIFKYEFTKPLLGITLTLLFLIFAWKSFTSKRNVKRRIPATAAFCIMAVISIILTIIQIILLVK